MEWWLLIDPPRRPDDVAAASGSALNKSVNKIWNAVGHEMARRIPDIWRTSPPHVRPLSEDWADAPAVRCGNPGSIADNRISAD